MPRAVVSKDKLPAGYAMVAMRLYHVLRTIHSSPRVTVGAGERSISRRTWAFGALLKRLVSLANAVPANALPHTARPQSDQNLTNVNSSP